MKSIASLQKLKFEIGGYSSGYHNIKIEKHRAIYKKLNFRIIEEEKSKQLKITKEKLHKLIVLLNEIEVLNWKSEYENDVLDGTQWELELTCNGDLHKKSFGNNSYPDSEKHSVEMTPKFEQLLFILGEIIKKDLIREQI